MENVIEIQHKNCFGEVMKLKMDRQMKLWFKHEDCNNEFEEISKLKTMYTIGDEKKEGFKYTLSDDERIVLQNFISMSTKLVPKVKSYHWK